MRARPLRIDHPRRGPFRYRHPPSPDLAPNPNVEQPRIPDATVIARSAARDQTPAVEAPGLPPGAFPRLRHGGVEPQTRPAGPESLRGARPVSAARALPHLLHVPAAPRVRRMHPRPRRGHACRRCRDFPHGRQVVEPIEGRDDDRQGPYDTREEAVTDGRHNAPGPHGRAHHPRDGRPDP